MRHPWPGALIRVTIIAILLLSLFCLPHRQPLRTFISQPLVITDENLLEMMEALWEHTDDYLGQEIEMYGFVFDDPSLGPDDFVLARQIEIDDEKTTQVVGLLCRYPQRGQLQPGQWATARGPLAKIPFYNTATRQTIEIPYIQVTELIRGDGVKLCVPR